MQPSQYGLNFAGPFLGLNTVQAPHRLSPAFATIAENVLITRGGGVRPRDPWRLYSREGISGWPMVTGMLHLDVSKLAGSTDSLSKLRVLLKTQTGKLFLTSGFSGFEDLAPPQTLSDAPPTWVLANRRLYVIDGSPRMIQYDGEKVFTIGIHAPSVHYSNPPDGSHQVEFEKITGGFPGADAGYYYYFASFYNSTYGIESNAAGIERILHDGTSRIRVTAHPAAFPLSLQQGIDTVRIYRQHQANVDDEELGLPPRLIAELSNWPPGAPDFTWDNEVPDDEVTLSDVITGPFAPTRNGIPPAARIAVWYKNRMWYADPDDGTRLWFSELAFPEHVGSTSFIRIGGDPDDVITGMVEMAGQIIILKKASIWILSGDLETYDNAKVALASRPGVDFAESFPEVYKSKSKTGCHNSGGGNGAIVCGHPPLLYYSNANGLYRFDGADDRLVSDLIMDEWAEVLNAVQGISETDHSISYAVDLQNEVLYVCPAAVRTGNSFPQRILCYHWGRNRGDGVGVWTTITNIGDSVLEFLERLGIACIATCLGAPSDLLELRERVEHVSPLLVAELYWYTPPLGDDPTFYTAILHAESREGEQGVVPPWLWRTGDLLLAGGKKAHMYYLEYSHERAQSEVGGGPTVKVQYAVDDGAIELLSPSEAGQDTKGVFMRRLQLGRTGRSLALQFARGAETDWESWNGLTGFAVDVELAEQR